MKILVLGGDGYLGWPTGMYFSQRGHDVALLDNGSKREWEAEVGGTPLFPTCSMEERARAWQEVTGKRLRLFKGDLREYDFVHDAVESYRPDAIIHYGEQPSAPYSMMDEDHAVFSQVNNVVGTLHVLWAMKRVAPNCHLVKLGTLGEYGTPNIDIEEGFLEVEHKGRKDRIPFPKQPGSFYHLSKVHDSHNIAFACRVWKLASTDLNQGVVYGIETEESRLDPRFETSFHYDAIFGTALNRFCVQAIAGIPLTIYGKGAQMRGFLNIRDTLRCVELAVASPAQPGEYRVFNQLTEIFSIAQLAEIVAREARKMGFDVRVDHLPNPRVELEEHYYNVVHDHLLGLGLKPRLLSDELIDSMLKKIAEARHRIRMETILPHVSWKAGAEAAEKRAVSSAAARER
ncbi:MAG TPA: NAD-dependent epimerase/dehydratase family protein [Candidatus Limnocylindrales bacterium]|nr:NAD-dependent epimerase/dehydratase family protein [Candidatus Limnocylindrales bacterium]